MSGRSGWVTTASETCAGPSLPTAPSGPSTATSAPTPAWAAEKVRTIWLGASVRTAPSAGSLPSSASWASAGAAHPMLTRSTTAPAASRSPVRRKGAVLRPGPLGVWAGGCRTALPLLVCRCRAGRHVLDPTTGQPDNRTTGQPDNRTTGQPDNRTTGQPYAVTARPGTAPPSRGHPIGSGGPSAPLIPYCSRLSGTGSGRSPGQVSA